MLLNQIFNKTNTPFFFKKVEHVMRVQFKVSGNKNDCAILSLIDHDGVFNALWPLFINQEGIKYVLKQLP